MPQRRRQPKPTPVAAAVAAVDERRRQTNQRVQANQRRAIDETEVIPTPPLPRARIGVSRNPRISSQNASRSPRIPSRNSRTHAVNEDVFPNPINNQASENEIPVLSSEIEELELDEEDELEEEDLCNNPKVIIKTTLRVDKKAV